MKRVLYLRQIHEKGYEWVNATGRFGDESFDLVRMSLTALAPTGEHGIYYEKGHEWDNEL